MKQVFLNEKTIIKYLNILNEEMKKNNLYGDINLVGGAVMCLVSKSRNVTKDIDAVFEPKMKMYNLIEKIAQNNNLSKDWLNDSVKGYLSPVADFAEYTKLSNLNVNVATPEYMLAMKCLSARSDNTNEKEDIKYLIKFLNLKKYEDVEKIITKYYPADAFFVKTKYIIMEVLENET